MKNQDTKQKIEKYLEQGLTFTEIGYKLGYQGNGVKNIMTKLVKELNVIRPKRPRDYLTRDLLRVLYIDKNWSKGRIAKTYNSTFETVSKKLDLYDLSKSFMAVKKSAKVTWNGKFEEQLKRLGTTEKELRKLYIEDNLSAKELSERFCIPVHHAHRILNKLNIKKSATPIRDSVTKEILQENYIEKNMTQRQLTRQLGVCSDTIRAARERHGIKKSKEKIQESIENTWFKKYGVKNVSHSTPIKKIISQKVTLDHSLHPEKRDNNKKEEKIVLKWVREIFPDTLYNKQVDSRYPFACDYFVPSKDLFIEYQGFTLSHGIKPYSKYEESEKVNSLKLKCNTTIGKIKKIYKNALNVYTRTDPRRRKEARENNLNFLEIWRSDYLLGKEWVQWLVSHEGLPIRYLKEQLQSEFLGFKNKEGEFLGISKTNKIVLAYQFGFYKKERALWNNPIVRGELVKNREKYLKPLCELSTMEILRGFRISQINKHAFSHFNPLIVKAFIEKYRVKSIYDPCAGWGHRLLGAASSGVKYTGVDTNKDTVTGLKTIIKDFNLKNCKIYNGRAEKFNLKNKYDAVFTCPPYFDLEKYEGKKTSTQKFTDYESWVNVWWRQVITQSLKCSPLYFAFVTSDKLVKDMGHICEEQGLRLKDKIPLLRQKSHFNKESRAKDFLLVFEVPK